MIVDLHNHAEYSHNTSVAFEDYINRAKQMQVAVAITEHNCLLEWNSVVDGVLVLSGIEILNDCGDFLIFGASEDCINYRDVFELIDYVHHCGGVIIAAHPYAGNGVCRAVDSRLAERVVARVDAVEVLNGRISPEEWRKANRLALVYGKPCTGGSDAHRPDEMFRAATYFERTVRSMDDLVREIRHGRCFPIMLENIAMSSQMSVSELEN